MKFQAKKIKDGYWVVVGPSMSGKETVMFEYGHDQVMSEYWASQHAKDKADFLNSY